MQCMLQALHVKEIQFNLLIFTVEQWTSTGKEKKYQTI